MTVVVGLKNTVLNLAQVEGVLHLLLGSENLLIMSGALLAGSFRGFEHSFCLGWIDFAHILSCAICFLRSHIVGKCS